jgi:hypothetical protein
MDQGRPSPGPIPGYEAHGTAGRRHLSDPWKDVRRFILQHPTEIDLRKVDQLWFLDLITNGLVQSK